MKSKSTTTAQRVATKEKIMATATEAPGANTDALTAPEASKAKASGIPIHFEKAPLTPMDSPFYFERAGAPSVEYRMAGAARCRLAAGSQMNYTYWFTFLLSDSSTLTKFALEVEIVDHDNDERLRITDMTRPCILTEKAAGVWILGDAQGQRWQVNREPGRRFELTDAEAAIFKMDDEGASWKREALVRIDEKANGEAFVYVGGNTYAFTRPACVEVVKALQDGSWHRMQKPTPLFQHSVKTMRRNVRRQTGKTEIEEVAESTGEGSFLKRHLENDRKGNWRIVLQK